jgi:hypothetical protein
MHPKELGRLGIPDPKNLNWALRLRWQWLRKIDPTKPWASLPFQANAELEAFFSMVVVTETGMAPPLCFGKIDGCPGKPSRI